MRQTLILAFFGLTVIQCADPFNFEVIGSEEVLVIDASFTNEQRAHEVRMSYSFPLDEQDERPATGANLWIEDDEGGRIPLTEQAPGRYFTADGVSGAIGQQYELHIEIDGRKLVSTPETMLEPIPIDSIYGQYIGLPFDDGTFQFGIQFFLDARGDLEKARSYRFDFEETHQISLRYGSLFDWSQESEIWSLRDTTLRDCYNTEQSTELLIATSDGLSDNSILEFPIRFVSETDPELRVRYSLIVRQYALSAQGYKFYRDVKDTNEAAGSFFDEQKGRIPGNIADVDDPTFPVLGYFEVAGVSETRRIFTTREFFASGFRPFVVRDCDDQLDTIPRPQLPDFFSSLPTYNIYQFESEPPNPAIVGPPRCTDCRRFGVLTKPDFWP